MTPKSPNVLDMFHGDNRELLPDFAALKRQGIFAVCHKASQGWSFVDQKYIHRHDAAKLAGMCWGAYHFLTLGDGKRQAEKFLSVAGNDCHFYAADFEKNGANQASIFTLVDFVRAIDFATGKKCFIYSGDLIRESLNMKVKSPEMATFFGGHPLWLAEYGPSEYVPWPWRDATLWQYSESGIVATIAGKVDLNFFDGTEADFLAAKWNMNILAS